MSTTSPTLTIMRRTPSPAQSFSGLSPRELEIANLAELGNAEIATVLVISVFTVKAHMRAIMAKLGVESRMQVARWAWEQAVGLRKPIEVENAVVVAEMRRA